MVVNKTGVIEVNTLAELNSIDIKYKGQRVKVIDTTGDLIATGNAYYEWDGISWNLDKHEITAKEINDKLLSNDTSLDTIQEIVDLLKSFRVSNNFARVNAVQATTSNTLTNIIDLVLPVEANSVYEIMCYVTFKSSSTTNGLNLGILTPPSSVNNVEIVVPITNTAAASQLRTIFPNSSVATNAGNVIGTGVSATNNNQTAMITGIITTSSISGDCQIRFASETNGATTTVQVGSIMSLKKIS